MANPQRPNPHPPYTPPWASENRRQEAAREAERTRNLFKTQEQQNKTLEALNKTKISQPTPPTPQETYANMAPPGDYAYEPVSTKSKRSFWNYLLVLFGLALLVGGLLNQPGRIDLSTSPNSQTSAPLAGDSQRYAVNLIENSLAMRKVADPVDIARQAYEVMVRLVGERDVLRAAAEMQSAGHDKNGALNGPLNINSSPVNLDAHDSTDPLFAFTALVTSYDERGYAIGAFLGKYYAQYAELWRGAERSYTVLVQKYGEKAVLAAAARVRAAPKMEDGTLTDLSGSQRYGPATWLSQLLSVPGAQLPTDTKPAVLSASEPDRIRAYSGKLATVIGTISRLSRPPYGVYSVFFRDSPQVTCFVYPAEREIFRAIETDPSSWTGKTIEVFGDIFSYEKGLGIRALSLKEIQTN